MKFIKDIKVSNIILFLVIILLTVFTIRIIHLIEYTGYEPSTLIASVYGAALGEFGVMGWIKNTKTRNGDSSENFSGYDKNNEGGVG